MIYRGCIYILAILIVGLTSFSAFAEWRPFDPEIIARQFSGDVVTIKADTSIPKLMNMKLRLQDLDDNFARSLKSKKAAVESIHKEITDLDYDIQTINLFADRGGNYEKAEAEVAEIKARRKQLVSREEIAYKNYVTCRGQSIVFKIMFELLLNEIDKRLTELGNNTAIDNLGNNTATGTWSVVHIKLGESESARGGWFSLTIFTNGVISGKFHEVGVGLFLALGKWNPADGGCEGKIQDPLYHTTWKGNLKKGLVGYTGSGTLEYKTFEATSRDGRWATR